MFFLFIRNTSLLLKLKCCRIIIFKTERLNFFYRILIRIYTTFSLTFNGGWVMHMLSLFGETEKKVNIENETIESP